MVLTLVHASLLAQGGVTGAADPIVYGLSSGGYGDWKCCSQLPHSCYEGLPQACGGKYSGTVSEQPPSSCSAQAVGLGAFTTSMTTTRISSVNLQACTDASKARSI